MAEPVSPDAYASYEAGLRLLLERIARDHPLHADALTYQQRLLENIRESRSFGDTGARKAARTEVIHRLNELASEALGLSFNQLCDQASPTPVREPSKRLSPRLPNGPAQAQTERIWSWQRLRLPLGLVGLLGLAIGVSIIVLGSIGRTGQPTPTTTLAMASAVAAGPGPTPTVTSTDCTPTDVSELPPRSKAIIENLKSGTISQVDFSTLRYEHSSGLRLASGITIDFKRMRRFELSNPGFTTDFAADVIVTFLDCTTHTDRIQSESGSFLTGQTGIGPLELHILEVKRVDFEW